MTNKSLSLNHLISNVLTTISEDEYVVLPDEKVKATTIRLEPSMRKFCEVKAAKLDISLQAFISQTLKAVIIQTTSPVKFELTLMRERFFEVFKINNITIQEIPLILKDYNITLGKLANEERLLDAYTPALLDFLSNKFNVNQEWLAGRSQNQPKN